MFDVETEAIGKCSEALSTLDDKAKVRVLQYLANRYELVGPNPGIGIDKAGGENLPSTLTRVNNTANQSKNNSNNSEYPVLKDVVKRDLPKTEIDWVVIYCFYASDYGEEWFTREDIIEKYKESSRWTETRRKNFSGNLDGIIKRLLIKSVNNKEYQMTDAGKLESAKILEGNSTSVTRKGGGRKKSSSKKNNSSDLHSDDKE